ncbi:hypothetical protein GCM10010478_48410 [Streptomyces erythrogriseus]|uniref:Uncharacterized protein n=2 Tax=Streptomyces griseoincarnatus group TaxID=2867193 RepID=A0ABP6JPF3_9ACTN|nr:hypothetical protein GCM10010265_60670 [Streptomyces griseoincarnatus]GGT75202.1 hypothetical protein GCM10010287_56930 [Streptomyces variabilis]
MDERHPKATTTKNRQLHTDTFPPKSHPDLTRAPKGRGELRDHPPRRDTRQARRHKATP